MPKGGMGVGTGTPAGGAGGAGGAGAPGGGGLADMLGGSSPLVNILRAMSGVQRFGGGGQNPAPLVPQGPAAGQPGAPGAAPPYLHYQPPPQFVRQPLPPPPPVPLPPEDPRRKLLDDEASKVSYQDYNNVGA